MNWSETSAISKSAIKTYGKNFTDSKLNILSPPASDSWKNKEPLLQVTNEHK